MADETTTDQPSEVEPVTDEGSDVKEDEQTREAEETVSAEPVLFDEEAFKRLLAAKGTDRLKMQRELGVVNPIEFAKLLGVRPQMIYNYIRSGKIKAAKHNNTQKLYIEADEADRFAREYLGRKQARAQQIERELQAS
jgi:hypothetical protein